MSELSKNAIIYSPEHTEQIAGVVQVLHGMAEYQGRYRSFAQQLTQHGYVVVTCDLPGHGNHVARNSELGFFGDNAISRLTGDIHDNTRYIRDHFPGVPHLMVGHGIGALLATAYFKKYDNFIDGLFLSGIPADRSLRPALSLLLTGLSVLQGEYHRSKLVHLLMMGRISHAFSREGSEHAWLTADSDSLRRYEADPKCGFIYTINGFRTILEMMEAVYTKGSWIRKHPACPIRIFCGEDDPVVVNKKSFMKSVHLFSDNGYTNVAYIMYPGRRHELFQSGNPDIPIRDLLREMETIRGAKVPHESAKAPTHIVLDDFIDPEVNKPLKKAEKINLEDFINAHKDESSETGNKVEMVDVHDLTDSIFDDVIASASSDTEAAPETEDYTPRPLDSFSGFKIDPDNLDGIS